MREKQEENKGKQERSKRNQATRPRARLLLRYLEFSSHIKGKFMNLECFSIMFDASFACYDKLGQGLWVIKA